MRRRDFISGMAGSAALWPVAPRAQERVTPVIGFLHAGSEGPSANYIAVFRQALANAGYVENRNVTIDYRYAEGNYARLSELATDLVRRQVTVIVAAPNANVVRAAKAATSAIPIVFMMGDDPVKFGIVASLNRPGGNMTGVNFFISELASKRLGLFRELLPAATRIGVLANPSASATAGFIEDLVKAATAIRVQLEIVRARDSVEIEAAFASLTRGKADALIVAPDTLFATQKAQIVTLAKRHAIPAIYPVRSYVDQGGLISYGPSIPDTYRQLAIYAGRILKGDKPADLPVVQSSKFDLIINLPTAKALGLEIPPMLLARADEVIE